MLFADVPFSPEQDFRDNLHCSGQKLVRKSLSTDGNSTYQLNSLSVEFLPSVEIYVGIPVFGLIYCKWMGQT